MPLLTFRSDLMDATFQSLEIAIEWRVSPDPAYVAAQCVGNGLNSTFFVA